jgi:hypothetical protein
LSSQKKFKKVKFVKKSHSFFSKRGIFYIFPMKLIIDPSLKQQVEAKLAFQRLQKYKKILPADFDYKKELEAIRNEKYEKYENSRRH